ncbi:MAG: hypothetical protein ACRDKF_11630 [Actinomycetota bacterium]
MSPLWRLVRKLFGKPKGRHAMGVAPVSAPLPVAWREPEPEPVRPAAPELTPVTVAAAPEPAAAIGGAPPLAPLEPVPDLGPVRLIFSDGSSAALPAGSPEERRARYLAESVLEATARV